jgi:hypothetical protein
LFRRISCLSVHDELVADEGPVREGNGVWFSMACMMFVAITLPSDFMGKCRSAVLRGENDSRDVDFEYSFLFTEFRC